MTLFRNTMGLLAVVMAAALCAAPAARADFAQQGPKLTASDALPGAPGVGWSSALSADGNTAVVGGFADGVGGVQTGAVWVFTRSGGVWSQEGNKLVANDNVDGAGGSNQGNSVAVSADGNTLIMGGPNDDGNAGAAWVFTRSGGVWSQQGNKLVGSDGNFARQGFSVALSADGDTAIVGGPTADGFTGAAWVFTRSGGVWTEQARLIGTGGCCGPLQGFSVALSADGNTAAVGGNADGNPTGGAVWIFTRSGVVWTQQGNKLIPTGATGSNIGFGSSLAISADGNTFISGAPFDDPDGGFSATGASWVFTRSGGVWTQQGGKLAGTGVVGSGALQGTGVGLSWDGNTAIIGGPDDDSGKGAVWVFIRLGSDWVQFGSKLVGTGASGCGCGPFQGNSVAMSGDGKTAVAGGPQDDSGIGAAWPFIRLPLVTHDFNGDSKSDIVWRRNDGVMGMWLMDGFQITQAPSLGLVPTSWSVVGQRDYNGDARNDWLWRNTLDGTVALWLLNGANILQQYVFFQPPVPTTWTVAGTGDFDGDGRSDVLWRNTATGDIGLWFMNGATILQVINFGSATTNWSIVETADFNGDGKRDILWRKDTGELGLWLMDGSTVQQSVSFGVIPTSWTVAGTGDFDGDGKSDILWRNSTGEVDIWFMNGASILQGAGFGTVPSAWNIVGTGDFDGDGKSDILWRHANGMVGMWLINGVAITAVSVLGEIGLDWSIAAINAN